MATATLLGGRMTKSRQKSEERFYLDQFIEATGCWSYVARFPEGTGPDFLVNDRRGPLGVELTSVQTDDKGHGSNLARAEGERDRFLREVRRHYDGAPITLDAIELRPEELDASHVAMKLKAIRPQDWKRVQLVIPSQRGSRRPSARFQVVAVPEALGHARLWQAWENHSGWGRLVSDANQFAGVVLRKAAKIEDYRRAVGRVALLIYAKRTQGSGMFGVTFDAPSLMTAHGFEEVHLCLHPVQVLRIFANPDQFPVRAVAP